MTISSPDGKIKVSVATSGALTYNLTVDSRPVLAASRLGMSFVDGSELGRNAQLVSFTTHFVNKTWKNRFGKHSVVRDRHNELRLTFREKSPSRERFEVVFRVFDDGIGFRYVLPSRGDGNESFVVTKEMTTFAFNENHACFMGTQGKFTGPQEWVFQHGHIADIGVNAVIGLPLVVQTPAAWIALTESDLRDWAGMWIGGESTQQTAGVTLSVKLAPRREGDGLVKAKAPHNSPWRVVMIGREPGRLIESDIVLNLATPCEMADSSWVKPGMMAWDHWWSGDCKVDTATIKQFIQFAADMGWSYQLIDWQWYGPFNSPNSDITKVNPAIDMNEVRRFAQEKGIRLWLWLFWTDVERNNAYEKAFELYEKWGIAGVKIDFMDSDDQFMVNWYEKITKAAAKHKLMVDFHGAYKPTGLNRTFPNQITREGIMGNEYNKMGTSVTPEHRVTLPFTRFLAGPGDFTPGGFLNRQPSQFRRQIPTLVQGTRASELALFVVYDSPVCCVADHPDHILNKPGSDFLKVVPTVWDDTRVLDGAVGEHLVMARKSGEHWFLGALTNRKSRSLPVNLRFLGHGKWKMKLWQDARDSDVNAENLEIIERTVTASDTLTLSIAPSGGAVAYFERAK